MVNDLVLGSKVDHSVYMSEIDGLYIIVMVVVVEEIKQERNIQHGSITLG